MEQKKKEIVEIIESLQDEQVLDYLLAFVQSFSAAYVSTSSPEIGAET